MIHQSEFNEELCVCWGASSRFALLGFMPFMVLGQPYGLENISEKRGRFFGVFMEMCLTWQDVDFMNFDKLGNLLFSNYNKAQWFFFFVAVIVGFFFKAYCSLSKMLFFSLLGSNVMFLVTEHYFCLLSVTIISSFGLYCVVQ